MGDRCGMSISADSPSNETLNRGPLALLLRRQYEFPFGINTVQFSFSFFIFIFIFHFPGRPNRETGGQTKASLGDSTDVAGVGGRGTVRRLRQQLRWIRFEGEENPCVCGSRFCTQGFNTRIYDYEFCDAHDHHLLGGIPVFTTLSAPCAHQSASASSDRDKMGEADKQKQQFRGQQQDKRRRRQMLSNVPWHQAVQGSTP